MSEPMTTEPMWSDNDPSANVVGGYKSHLTRRNFGLRIEDLAMLAVAFDFADALEFEEFAHTQQAKAMARQALRDKGERE